MSIHASLRAGYCLLLVAFVAASFAHAEDAPPPARVPERPPAAAVEGPQQYVFQIGLYRLNQPGEENAAGIRHFPERHPSTNMIAVGVPHTFGALTCEQCHVESWPRGGEAMFSRTLADRVLGEALTASVAQVIAEPVLSTVEGRPAQLRLEGGEVEYFVRDEEGGFRLEKIKDHSGVEVKLSVAEATQENDTLNVTVDPFEIRITTLDHREPLAGVELPVGKPVFRTFEWDATLTCRPGQMNAFTVDSPRQGRILVVVRLQVPGQSEQSTKREDVRQAF